MSLLPLIEPALVALGQSPQELQIADLETVLRWHYPHLSPDRPALLGVLKHPPQCEKLSRLLGLAYPAAHPLMLIVFAPCGSPETRALSLEELGQGAAGSEPSLLYVPPLPFRDSVEAAQDTVAHLRVPAGCPWDRKQTHQSLRQGFQEEAYEVLDALDRGDLEALQEELGDVLLHILMQTQIASESDEFRLSDIVSRVNRKIIHRHPHVFSGLAVDGVEEVLVNWEVLKQQEKEGHGGDVSVLDSVSPAMPALARAQSIQRHIARTGIVSREPGELSERIAAGLLELGQETGHASPEIGLGDLLFELCDLAGKLGIDAESALRAANSRFEQRFRALEGPLMGAAPGS